MKNIFRISGVILLILSIFLIHSCKKKEEVPVITTTAVSNITATTATSGGKITSEGSSTVISRGLCWSTGTTPTIVDSKTTDGAGAGSFSGNMMDLNSATIYYVRAYATNSAGTGYGMAISFTTLGEPPIPEGYEATNINATGAILNGSVNANYLSTIVTFEYGTTTSYGTTITASQSPMTENTFTNVSTAITGLTPATFYHYRIKAVNSLGTSYSSDVIFTTLGQVPTVVTMSATNSSTTSGSVNGSVNANYLSSVATFEFGTTTGYGSTIVAIQSPVTGSISTNVSVDITGLTPATIYHYRIKAVNSLGASYGNDAIFTTLGQVPTVATKSATISSATSVSANGSVNANYLSSVTTFEYGTSISYGSTVTASQSPVTGNTSIYVSANITGLTPATTYHYRVKAVNSLGTSFGIDMSFITDATSVTDSDGNIYQIIRIGTQVWMAENLKTTKYTNGDIIGTTTPATLDISGETAPKYQWAYNGNESNVAIYGRLYTWYAVTDSRNVCPTSWHMPTDAEWIILTTYLGGEGIAGGKLKEAGTTHWQSANTGKNESGFTALPGGWRYIGGTFFSIGLTGSWLSSTEYSMANAYSRTMFYDNNSLERGSSYKLNGYSIRCVKD